MKELEKQKACSKAGFSEFGSSDWTRTSSVAPVVSGFQKMVSVFTIIFTSIFNAVSP
ncbi:TPA: hypothetical protein M4K80_000005 [Salmonella enterica]|nr:hypothetical protein [Salmonella enterica]